MRVETGAGLELEYDTLGNPGRPTLSPGHGIRPPAARTLCRNPTCGIGREAALRSAAAPKGPDGRGPAASATTAQMPRGAHVMTATPTRRTSAVASALAVLIGAA